MIFRTGEEPPPLRGDTIASIALFFGEPDNPESEPLDHKTSNHRPDRATGETWMGEIEKTHRSEQSQQESTNIILAS
jgi:hypothetical protein